MSELESKVLEVIGRYKHGDAVSIEDVKVLFDYCISVEDVKHCCPGCVLRKKFGKCPIVVSLP
jgi:hypothetical protein